MKSPPIKPRDKRRYTETIRQAHLGVREAQYEVGLMYANGVGTAQNLALAIEWVAKAANKGLPAAQYLLATRYALGIVVERDERAAMGWYLNASEQGYAKATLALGRFFAEPHPQLANELFEEAAKAGNVESQYALAVVLGEQAQTMQEQAQALRWLDSAARQGHSKAQVLLGQAYAKGRGVEQDNDQARGWFRAAVRQGSPIGQVALAELDVLGGRANRENFRSRSAERRETRNKWELLPASLDPEEVLALGIMYQKGLGVDQDLQRATALYRKAAEMGDPRAQCALAEVLAVDQQFDAMQWALRAAKAGNLDGMLLAGTLHLKNLGTGIGDALTAVAWLGQAAASGEAQGAKFLLQVLHNHSDELEAQCLLKQALTDDAQAQMEYGVCLEVGRGVAQNPSDAKRWIGLAAEAGYAKAQTHLGLSILRSQSEDNFMARAASWLERAAQQGDSLAQWHLGGLFAKGGSGLKQDLKHAFHWCSLAANNGFVPAQATLGYLYNRIGDHQLAKIWLERAALAGDAEAQLNLALLFTQMDLSKSGNEIAAEWLLAAAEGGLALAQTELGLRYVKGQGLISDPVEAHKWFTLAAERGEPAALENLKISEARLSILQRTEGAKRAKAWASYRQLQFHNMEKRGEFDVSGRSVVSPSM